MKKVFIYTDGACKGNPGAGGWAALLQYGEFEKTITGGERNTTNNRMELMAVIQALKLLKEPCEVTLYTDSQYICNALERGWAMKWKSNGWMRNSKDKTLNPDLWEILLDMCEIHTITPIWIKGHSGHPQNEICDKLATKTASKYM